MRLSVWFFFFVFFFLHLMRGLSLSFSPDDVDQGETQGREDEADEDLAAPVEEEEEVVPEVR